MTIFSSNLPAIRDKLNGDRRQHQKVIISDERKLTDLSESQGLLWISFSEDLSLRLCAI